jgi:SAM-dependent methyltransferase
MMEQQEPTRGEYWDENAGRYGPEAAVLDRSDRLGLKNRYLDLVHRLALTEALAIDGQLVVDFGCGYGRLFPLLSEHARQVIGVDVSVELLESARRTITDPRCSLLHFDGVTLPLAASSVDAVLSVYTLQYFTDDARLADIAGQIGAALRPQGRLYLLEQVGLRSWQRSEDSYRRVIESAGFVTRNAYPIRNGRSVLLYAIRYGLVPPRALLSIARREVLRTRMRPARPWARYQDYIFVFDRSS